MVAYTYDPYDVLPCHSIAQRSKDTAQHILSNSWPLRRLQQKIRQQAECL